jgi:hypothetical protein
MFAPNRIFTLPLVTLLLAACGNDPAGGTEPGNEPDGGVHTGGQNGSGGSGGKADDDGGAGSGGKADDDGGGSGSGGTQGSGGAKSTGGSTPGEPAPSDGKTPFFLPTDTPTNTAAPRVEVDRFGGVHMLYPAFAIGDAFYGYCENGCAGPDDVTPVRLETQGSVSNAALAVDEQGRPRAILATFTKVYFASCDEACTEAASWTTTEIMDHGSEREVSGEALALEGGKPRFIMHAYRKFLGAFQKPETFFVSCDADCHDPASWETNSISPQLWEGSKLLFDSNGVAHVGTVVQVTGEGGLSKIAAYYRCDGDCASGTSWHGNAREYAYEKIAAEPPVQPTVSLALTRAGAPRLLVLGKGENGEGHASYHECDSNCLAAEGWAPYMQLTDPNGFGAGLDLSLDSADHPRVVFTSGYSIALASCNAAHCTDQDAEWTFATVEKASSMKPDEIITWPNCTVSGWMLNGPSLALASNGALLVGYQARDVSGGFSNPDPTRPACTAGTDMAFTRLASLAVPK